MDAEVVDLEVGRVEAVQHGAQRTDPAVARHGERERVVVASGLVEQARGGVERRGIREPEPDVPARARAA